MSTLMKVLLGLGLLGGITIFSIVGIVISTNNEMINHEQGVIAQYKQNQNNYDNYFKKLQEASQVASMYADDLKSVYDSALKGRYGKDGSKAVLQFIREHNPNLDASVYKQLQQIIESGRDSFEANQTSLLDKKRVYETRLKVFPSNLIAGLLGFPKIDLSKYDIVTSDETEKAFETKKTKPIKVRE